jgi:hypothetical protein
MRPAGRHIRKIEKGGAGCRMDSLSQSTQAARSMGTSHVNVSGLIAASDGQAHIANLAGRYRNPIKPTAAALNLAIEAVAVKRRDADAR